MTEPPGWASPTGDGGFDEPALTPPPTPPAPGSGWGPPPGYQPPGPGAPYGTAPPGTFGQQPTAWTGGTAQGGWGRGFVEPGIVPLRPLSLGEILDGGFAVVRKSPLVTLGLSAMVVAATTLLTTGLQYYALVNADAVDPETIGGIPASFLLALMVSAVGTVLLAGMLTVVMGEAVLGRSTTIGATWAKVRPRFFALLGASILGGVVPILGLFLCIVPGVFLWGAWAFLTPVVVLERTGPITAIKRSWRLAVPDWWRVWGIRALAFLIAFVIAFAISLPARAFVYGSTMFSGTDIVEYSVLQIAIMLLAEIVAGTITAPFGAGVIALLYIDRRMRAEGLDVTLAQAAAQQGP